MAATAPCRFAWLLPFAAAVTTALTAPAVSDETAGPERTSEAWIFACSPENDLYRVLAASGCHCRRFATAAEAVRAAPDGSGVLVLADGYPEQRTAVTPEAFDEAAAKRLRLYLEYPAGLPGMEVGPPKDVTYERGVVTSEVFGESLRPMRIVLVSSCRYVPVQAVPSHLVLAKVAGVDTAVFGLEGTVTEPLLFDHPRGNLLVATTKLSDFVRGRHLPTEAWRAIWETILARLHPEAERPELRWTPGVRPSFSREDPLPANAESQALRRSADWIRASRILRHGDWPQEILARSLTYNTVREMPRPDWPPGDGSLGILEGFSSTIQRDGSQPVRYAVRNDCVSEVAMLLALDAAVHGRAENAGRAANLVDYVYGTSGLAGGPRADPDSPSYGLVAWALDHPGSYWGDDNARALLAVGAVAALAGEQRWDEALARTILGNFRTTGHHGFRPACVEEQALQDQGWRAYWTGRHVHYSPHRQSWLWACYFWAYRQTGFEPLRARSESGMRRMMQAYPARWDWILRSGTIERARLLLPLAWLIRVDDTPEHRRWLRQIAEDLIDLQDGCGAIREVIGDGGQGLPSNAAYGTGEASLIQADGDPVCDLLYACNFALIGLHEAAAATGEPFYAEAEDRLARFLCRVQVRSEDHPELEGAWYRAFDYLRWDYWATSADWEWGPWCTETGWCQPWIAGTMGLRCRRTSLWDLLQQVDLNTHFDRLRGAMLPDDALAEAVPAEVSHAARGKSVRLALPPDPRYPGIGAIALTDGEVAQADYQAGEWLGFEAADLEAVIDLETPVEIRDVVVRCLLDTSVGVYLPVRIEISLAHDGQEFHPAGQSEVPQIEPGPVVHEVRAEMETQLARYVRVRAVNVGVIPAGQPGAGRKAWLFVDELVVNP